MSDIKKYVKKIHMKISPQYRKLHKMENDVRDIKQTLAKLERENMTYQYRNQNMLWLLLSGETYNIRNGQTKFWKSYPKATGKLKIVQQGNLYLIKELKKICDRLNINFWLHGGTLIGALRHEGFIPWDDDVDVAMLRSDLEKLIDYLKDDDFFQMGIYYHDDNKFSKGYQFRTRDREFCCFVDIFVFDYFPFSSNEFDVRFQENRRSMVNEFLHLPNKPTPHYISYHFAEYDEKGRNKIDEIIKKYLENLNYTDEGKFVYYSIENYPFPYPLMKISDVFPCKIVPFEDIELQIPNNSDFYLKGYGDYWQVPKDIGRSPHFAYYEPHIEYMKEYLKKIQ